jgi:TonB family protein
MQIVHPILSNHFGAVVVSILLHGAILFFCCYDCFHQQSSLIIPAKIINSYIFQGQLSSKKTLSVVEKKLPVMIAKQFTNEKKTEAKKGLSKPAFISKHNSIQQRMATKSSNVALRSAKSIAENAALIRLLHAAIQQQQHYPANALALQREGNVDVGFNLQIDGQIADLHLVHSSGTASLDNAALTAVAQAAPFQQINLFLKQTTPFSLTVVFKIS